MSALTEPDVQLAERAAAKVHVRAIQQMLGHWHVGTTMRYVQPSSTFVEDAYVRAISDTLAEHEREED